MLHTISTKYVSPSNVKGSRCIAKASNGQKIIVEWRSALDSDENHKAAFTKLAEKLGWKGKWVYGDLDNGCLFILQTDNNNLTV